MMNILSIMLPAVLSPVSAPPRVTGKIKPEARFLGLETDLPPVFLPLHGAKNLTMLRKIIPVAIMPIIFFNQHYTMA